MDNAENVGTVYAPTDAQYLTSALASGLSNERVVQDGVGIAWDFTSLGQAAANWAWMGIEDLTDPNADRGMFWDDSAGAVKFFTPASGLEFVGTNLSITDADLVAIITESGFTLGDILYHNGTTLARLPAGTDGQFLRTRGTSTAPDWQNISGGGDMLSANNLSDLDSASTARTNLGVAIGTNVQAYDATLQSLSALGTAADRIAYTTAIDTWAETALTSFARTILDDADQAAVRTTLALTPGTDVQAYDAGLASIAGLTTAADKMIYTTALDTYAVADLTAFARSILDDADEATFKATVNLEIGVDVQAYDAELAALAGLTSAADKAPYFTGSGTAALADFTSFGRSLVDDANAAAARTTLELVIGTHVQAYSSVLANTTASFTTADETKVDYLTVTGATDLDTIRTKVGHITVTQAVDLDAIETRVNQLDASVVLSGTWDASAGTFPGGGTAQAGQSYIVSVGGTVDSVVFTANDRIVAILDNASTTTYASNWHKLDYTDAVLSVAGRTGAVTLAVADITDMSANGRSLVSAADYAAMKALLDLEIGTDVQAYDADLTTLGGLSKTDGNFIVADGAAWTVESGSTARASLGLTIGSDVQAYDELLNEIAALSTAPGADRGLFYDHSGTAIEYFTATNGIEFSTTNLQMTSSQRTRTITAVIDGGGSTITTGIKGDFRVPVACTITGVSALADQSGSIVVDAWVDTLANFPPTDADTITASAPITISSATNSEDTTLTGWDTALAAGDIIRFNVDSVTSIQRLTISITVTVT